MIAVLAITIQAQTNEEVEMYQAIFGMAKKAVVSEFISLEGQAAACFWTLNDQWESDRKMIGQKRISL